MSSTANRMVQFKLDPSNPPTLSLEQRQALVELGDEEIDLSDIPDQSGKTGWHRASPSPMSLVP